MQAIDGFLVSMLTVTTLGLSAIAASALVIGLVAGVSWMFSRTA